MFGCYGNILVRDHKMYVVLAPFSLAKGTAHRRTLILPAETKVDDNLVEIAEHGRLEVKRVVVAYNFNLRANEMQTALVDNPNAGLRACLPDLPGEGGVLASCLDTENTLGKRLKSPYFVVTRTCIKGAHEK